MLKDNKGLSLVEIVIVVALMGGVILFFWNLLSSSTRDSGIITEKIEVQNEVTSLMNIIQVDIQEARPRYDKYGEKSIFYYVDDDVYIINGSEEFIRYEFDTTKNVVRRITKLDENKELDESSQVAEYNYIISLTMDVTTEKNGANIKIIGSKRPSDSLDKTRYELNTSYYTRNTR